MNTFNTRQLIAILCIAVWLVAVLINLGVLAACGLAISFFAAAATGYSTGWAEGYAEALWDANLVDNVESLGIAEQIKDDPTWKYQPTVHTENAAAMAELTTKLAELEKWKSDKLERDRLDAEDSRFGQGCS